MSIIELKSRMKVFALITGLTLLFLFILYVYASVSTLVMQRTIVYENEPLQLQMRDMFSELKVSLTDIDTDIQMLMNSNSDMFQSYASAYDQLTVLNTVFLNWAEGQGLIIKEGQDV